MILSGFAIWLLLVGFLFGFAGWWVCCVCGLVNFVSLPLMLLLLLVIVGRVVCWYCVVC